MEYNKPPKLERRKYSDVGSMIFFKHLPYFFVALMLALVYVWNVNSVEREIRKNQILSEELKKLKWDYWSLKSSIMFNSTESQISKKVEEKQIFINDKAPKMLVRIEN
ncbi:MAG: FtsL-like putative cell division protein [Saprospiraceae bacterium]